MNRSSWLDSVDVEGAPEALWEDGERRFYKIWRKGPDGMRHACLAVLLATDSLTPSSLNRLAHEYALKGYFDADWALRPLELVRSHGATALVLEYQEGQPLDRMIAHPMEVGGFLRIAIAMTAAIVRLHECGLVHRDIKPANIWVDSTGERVWLTGFGVASRLPRERQLPQPPEFIAGTLSHVAPEQTGRMNRSVDSRSDLYSLGVILYQALTGSLPFTATAPLEWVHCHIARRPMPPSARAKDVPSQVSGIIMKLLAKTPEERYQTAAGVERDLRRCLREWENRCVIDEFPLGEQDRPDRLLIPEHLYGRETEIDALLATLEHVVANGTPSLVLVSGPPGIGKSSVVNELHKALVPSHGLFASGKLDQLKRDIPYATLAQVFAGLIRYLLSKPETELSTWRNELRQALDPNGALIVELIPELTFIIGEQPPVPDVTAHIAKARFQMALRRFIGVFARSDHPLVLFLDDVQWSDPATLDLLQELLIQDDIRHLLMIGAYRDTEVGATHPLRHMLAAILESGANVHQITLGPLKHSDLAQLIADTLGCDLHRVLPLAQLVYGKTAGNPFFANQFIRALAEERLIAFDPSNATWSWDLKPIQAKDYTDNVVELIVGKLGRLSLTTLNALKALACLGNTAEASTLAVYHGISEEKIHSDLWEALRVELIIRFDNSYRFAHDRVQEAAYSLIPKELRPQAHLRIGRLLAAHIGDDQGEEAVFDIVGHLNRGAALISSRGEREQLAELNLTAGKRAKAAAAWASALNYLIAGIALVPEDVWERRHDLIFELELYRAECEFLTGEMASAEEHLRMLASRAADVVQRAAVACLLADLYFAFQEPDRAVDECLGCLRHAGLDLPLHATEEQALAAYDRICSKLDGLGIDELAAQPLMTDPTSRAILDVLAKIAPSALVTHRHLVALVVCAAVDISLKRGHCDSSCFAYEYLGFIAGWNFGDFKAGFRFGRLGYELMERKGLRKCEGYVGLLLSGPIMQWAIHVASCRELIRTTFAVANRTGDRLSAAASCGELVNNLLFAGEQLVEVEKEAEVGLEFCRRAAFSAFADRVNIQAAFIRNLRGLTHPFGSLDDHRFDELQIQMYFESQPHLLACEFWYWARRLQARFFAGDYAAALDASIRAQRLRSESPGALELVEHDLYSALTRAAVCDSASPDERQRHLEVMTAHLRQLESWARHCPENFENCASLMAAELARVEGRDLDAMRLYEQAIRSARENGFVHNEALAIELAARFYAARGFDRIATSYLRDARYGYLQWGADGKVRQLDELHPYLAQENRRPELMRTVETPVEQLDLAVVLSVLEAVSCEIDSERLIATVMRLGLEQAGAERGLLILPRGSGYQVEAEAATASDAVTVARRESGVTAEDLPESAFHFVLRTRETVLLHDASVENAFSGDPYILRRRPRSVLCLPLLKQTRMVGVLYLENSLIPGVFTPVRMALLKLLASEAAVSIENARDVSERRRAEQALRERERESRQILDTIPGLVAILTPTGEVDAANHELIAFCGQALEAMKEWGTNGTVHPEDLPHMVPIFTHAIASGEPYDFEARVRRYDGVYRWLQIRGLPHRDTSDQIVRWYVLLSDVEDRKRAEEVIDRARSEFARVARVVTLGALTASIAHEVNQPLSGIITNAGTCLRMLNASPPNIDGARETAKRTIRDGNRASDVISRLRVMFSKREFTLESMDLNEATREVVALSRNDLQRHRVALQLELTEPLPPIMGDRVQLQQVILNLLRNASEAMADVVDRPRRLLVKTVTGSDAGVRMIVQDTGVGVDRESLDKLFDAFYTTKQGGMGIGLSVSRSIIERHHGRMWAEPNDGPGATFSFTIPRA